MRPSRLLRALSVWFPVRLSSPPVAPWPDSNSFDGWLKVELHALRCPSQQSKSYASARWLLNALDIALSTQRKTIESLLSIVCQERDRKAIENYLEDAVELLDTCNRLRERMVTVQNYIESLRIVLHCFEGRSKPNEAAFARARVVLDACEAMERRCAELEKCSSGLKKLGEKLAHGAAFGICGSRAGSQETGMCKTELCEVLNGSKAIVLLVCGLLGIALSFKPKRGLPAMQTGETSSLYELHKEVKEEIEKRRKSGNAFLTELRQTVIASQNLQDVISCRWRPEDKIQRRELRVTIDTLDKSCGELDEGIRPLEARVNELYRHLISIRMALLGILSQV